MTSPSQHQSDDRPEPEARKNEDSDCGGTSTSSHCCPGRIATPLVYRGMRGGEEEARRNMARAQPIPRAGQREDIAAIATFLASDGVDRPEFVVQVAPNRVEVDEFNRWAAPLNNSIARTVAGDLAGRLVRRMWSRDRWQTSIRHTSSRSTSSALSRFAARPRWSRQYGRCEGPRAGKRVRAAELRARLQDEGFDALAAAHSRGIAKMSGDIAAAAIRSEGGRKP